jgi:hypothetical protein
VEIATQHHRRVKTTDNQPLTFGATLTIHDILGISGLKRGINKI